MVSRYNAIKTIGNRAVQELPGPVSIGDVGNTEIKTTHGIYRVKLPLFNGNDAVLVVCVLTKSQYNSQSIHYKEELKSISERVTSKLVVM